MALRLTERAAPPRPGYPVFSDQGVALGVLSSGGLSPSLGDGIGLAYLPTGTVKIGTKVFIEMRGRRIPALVSKKPLFRK